MIKCRPNEAQLTDDIRNPLHLRDRPFTGLGNYRVQYSTPNPTNGSTELKVNFYMVYSISVDSLLTLWGPVWSPSCSRSRSWSAGRPLHGPAPATPGPGWSRSDARCTLAAGRLTSAAPLANQNTRTHAAWPIVSSPLGQPAKKQNDSHIKTPAAAEHVISCWWPQLGGRWLDPCPLRSTCPWARNWTLKSTPGWFSIDVSECIWMVIAPDDQVAPCMVASANQLWEVAKTKRKHFISWAHFPSQLSLLSQFRGMHT